MKILIAYHSTTDSDNPFVRLLAHQLREAGYDVTCSVDLFWNGAQGFDIVHLQWPEELFGWQHPSPDRLETLDALLDDIRKRGISVVYTRHNTKPHHGNDLVKEAYRLVEKHTDVFVHMGEYSREEYLTALPDTKQQHRIIPHHVYDALYPNIPSRAQARRHLGLKDNRAVMLAFGAFRNNEERRLVWRAFREAKVSHKYLLAPRMLPFTAQAEYKTGIKRLVFKALYYATRIVSPLFSCRVVSPAMLVPGDQLPWFLGAADVVIIQRTQILNSGNLPLALLFGRVVVGPAIGNVGEHLDVVGNPSFDPADSVSVNHAVSDAFRLAAEGVGAHNREYALEHYGCDRIAAMYGLLYDDIKDATDKK